MRLVACDDDAAFTPAGSVTLRSFEHHVGRYQHRIFGFACYFLGDREEAADVTQEVLLRLWNHRDEVEEDRLLGWLLRVARNACVDALRRRQVYRAAVMTDGEQLERAFDPEALPDAATASALFQEQLQRALGTLDDPYRSIVILREIQDYRYEEISEALRLPLNTVKVYLHRARKMLREQLREVMPRETV
jgi:RNA polymerase sigma-70 factor (ECF subfamily)